MFSYRTCCPALLMLVMRPSYGFMLRVYICRDGSGCLYTVMQWITVASVLQSGNWANRTVEAQVRTIQKTMIPVLSSENAPARRKTSHDIFRILSFFLHLLLILLFPRRCSARTLRSMENDIITELRGFRPHASGRRKRSVTIPRISSFSF